MLHGKDTHLLARTHAAHSVGHVQPGALLAHDDGANVRPCGGLNNAIDRIADQKLNPLALEDLGDSIRGLHNRTSVPVFVALRCAGAGGNETGLNYRPWYS